MGCVLGLEKWNEMEITSELTNQSTRSHNNRLSLDLVDIAIDIQWFHSYIGASDARVPIKT